MTHYRVQAGNPAEKNTARFLDRYIEASRAAYPAHGDYVLDRESLHGEDVEFWILLDGDAIAGCIALKSLDAERAEIKSLCVDAAFRGRGYGKHLVEHVIEHARSRQMKTLLLETGSMDFYAAARRLYISLGFQPCGVFGNYDDDPISCFMQLELVSQEY